MGKRASYNERNTAITASTTDSLTTIVPVCGTSSKPQCESVSRRKDSGPTGHPSRHVDGRSAAVTPSIALANGGAVAAGAESPGASDETVAPFVDAGAGTVVVDSAATGT